MLVSVMTGAGSPLDPARAEDLLLVSGRIGSVLGSDGASSEIEGIGVTIGTLVVGVGVLGRGICCGTGVVDMARTDVLDPAVGTERVEANETVGSRSLMVTSGSSMGVSSVSTASVGMSWNSRRI